MSKQPMRPTSNNERVSLFDSLVSSFQNDVNSNLTQSSESWNMESNDEFSEVSIMWAVRSQAKLF